VARRSTSTALLNSVPRLNHGLLLLRRFVPMLARLKFGGGRPLRLRHARFTPLGFLWRF
jgi:hypothetical protein